MTCCPECSETTLQVREGAYIWCTGCGAELEWSPQYLRGYATPMIFARRQAYSRAKRFRKYLVHVIATCKVSGDLCQNFDTVLDLYAAFEFLWQSAFVSTRKYFYAKPVMLKAVCMLLKIPVEGMPCLKDHDREVVQNAELSRLLKHQGVACTCLREYV